MLMKMSIDNVDDLVQQSGGFILHNRSGGGPAVLPSGFMYMMASTGHVGLRWTLGSDDADTVRVRRGLSSLLGAFPELRDPNQGMSLCLDYLKLDT